MSWASRSATSALNKCMFCANQSRIVWRDYITSEDSPKSGTCDLFLICNSMSAAGIWLETLGCEKKPAALGSGWRAMLPWNWKVPVCRPASNTFGNSRKYPIVSKHALKQIPFVIIIILGFRCASFLMAATICPMFAEIVYIARLRTLSLSFRLFLSPALCESKSCTTNRPTSSKRAS